MASKRAVLAVLFTATLLASALGKPSRRLLAAAPPPITTPPTNGGGPPVKTGGPVTRTDTGIGGWHFDAHYPDICYVKPHAVIEYWAIKFMCEQAISGKTETWLLENKDPNCRTKGEVLVVVGDDGALVITGKDVCETVKHKVQIDQSQCPLFLKPENKACNGYLNERTPPNIGNTIPVLTVHEIPEPKYAATVRYQVKLEAFCASLENPEFKGWAPAGEVFEGEECVGAAFNGDATVPQNNSNPF